MKTVTSHCIAAGEPLKDGGSYIVHTCRVGGGPPEPVLVMAADTIASSGSAWVRKRRVHTRGGSERLKEVGTDASKEHGYKRQPVCRL